MVGGRGEELELEEMSSYLNLGQGTTKEGNEQPNRCLNIQLFACCLFPPISGPCTPRGAQQTTPGHNNLALASRQVRVRDLLVSDDGCFIVEQDVLMG